MLFIDNYSKFTEYNIFLLPEEENFVDYPRPKYTNPSIFRCFFCSYVTAFY